MVLWFSLAEKSKIRKTSPNSLFTGTIDAGQRRRGIVDKCQIKERFWEEKGLKMYNITKCVVPLQCQKDKKASEEQGQR